MQPMTETVTLCLAAFPRDFDGTLLMGFEGR